MYAIKAQCVASGYREYRGAFLAHNEMMLGCFFLGFTDLFVHLRFFMDDGSWQTELWLLASLLRVADVERALDAMKAI